MNLEKAANHGGHGEHSEKPELFDKYTYRLFSSQMETPEIQDFRCVRRTQGHLSPRPRSLRGMIAVVK